MRKHNNSTAVKASAFEPPRDKTELSVADATGLNRAGCERLVHLVLDLIEKTWEERGRKGFKRRGWAELDAKWTRPENMPSSLGGVAMTIIRDDVNYERHCLLKGFPPPSEEALSLGLQQYLAAHSTLEKLSLSQF